MKVTVEQLQLIGISQKRIADFCEVDPSLVARWKKEGIPEWANSFIITLVTNHFKKVERLNRQIGRMRA